MQKAALLFVLLLSMAASSHALVINEIMYNPGVCADSECEWLELYNNDSFTADLTNWTIDTQSIGNFVLNPSEYIIIAKELVDNVNDSDSDSFEAFWGDGDGVWGNSPTENYAAMQAPISLNNADGTTVNLTDGIDSHAITYLLSLGGDGNDNTLCLYPDGSTNLTECVPTPGAANAAYQTPANNTNTTNTTIPDACDLSVSISSPGTIDSNQTLNYDIIISDLMCNNTAHGFVVQTSIEDIFGTPDTGFPETDPDSMTCSETIAKTWNPPSVAGSETYFIKPNILDPGCSDAALQNNNASATVIVVGTQESDVTTINITKVEIGADNEIKYGDSGQVSIDIYKGKTQKNAVDVYVRDSSGNKLSEVTNFNLITQHTLYSLIVPLQMKPNCDSSLPQGSQTLVVEGLGLTQTATIDVNGISSSTCVTQVVTQTVSSGSGGGGGSSSGSIQVVQYSKYEILDYKNLLEQGEEFTTKVKITNNFTAPKTFTVYSYVFKGNEPVSLGYNSEEGWRATYSANQVSVSLGAKSSSDIVLTNKIEEDTEPGEYSLRVRFVLDGKETDLTQEVEIIEKPAEEIAAETATDGTEEIAQTGEARTEKTGAPATGLVAAKPSGSMSGVMILSPIAAILQFLLSF